MVDKNKDINEDEIEEVNEASDMEDEKEATNCKDDEIANLKDQLLRLQADFMNFKRRNEEAKKSSMEYAVEKFALDILPCIDNFERALESNDEKTPFSEGVALIYDELLRVMEKNNIEEIDALDQDFDPNYHHAVFAEELDGVEANKVIEILQKGYKINDRVIRPAMVKVSK